MSTIQSIVGLSHSNIFFNLILYSSYSYSIFSLDFLPSAI